MAGEEAARVVRAMHDVAVYRWVMVFQAAHGVRRCAGGVELSELSFGAAEFAARRADALAEELLLGFGMAGNRMAWELVVKGGG